MNNTMDKASKLLYDSIKIDDVSNPTPNKTKALLSLNAYVALEHSKIDVVFVDKEAKDLVIKLIQLLITLYVKEAKKSELKLDSLDDADYAVISPFIKNLCTELTGDSDESSTEPKG